jgi:hypothetical protein
MTPYSRFEGIHKKIAIFQEIGNYLHNSQNVTNFNHKKIGLLDACTWWSILLSTSLTNLDEDISWYMCKSAHSFVISYQVKTHVQNHFEQEMQLSIIYFLLFSNHFHLYAHITKPRLFMKTWCCSCIHWIISKMLAKSKWYCNGVEHE